MVEFNFDDKNKIEKMIESKYVNTDNLGETIRQLARYNYYILGLKKEDNYDAIVKYMTENCSTFYEESYISSIYRYIAGAKKYKFRSIESIDITKSEIEKIKSLSDIRKEKIAFVLLAVAKYYNSVSKDNGNKAYLSLNDLYKLARVSIPASERASYLHFAYQDGILIPHTYVGSELKIIAFVSEIESDETVLTLNENSYKELAYEYLNYKNDGGYKRCKKCGRLFKMMRKEPARLYCKLCKPKYDAVGLKKLSCIDCETEFYVDSRNMTKCRCDDCQLRVDNEKNRLRVNKYRELHSM